MKNHTDLTPQIIVSLHASYILAILRRNAFLGWSKNMCYLNETASYPTNGSATMRQVSEDKALITALQAETAHLVGLFPTSI